MDMSLSKCEIDGIQTEKYFIQILAVLTASLSSLTGGIFFSWPSPFILEISKDKENYEISEEEASKFAMIPFIVTMLSCPIFSKLSDIYGRKRILLMTAFIDMLIWILKATGRSVYVFYLARALVGLSSGMMFASLPAYLGEVTAPIVRGTWGNSMAISFMLGELLATVVGSYFDVQETCYIFIPIPVVFLVVFYYMPESPYFHLMRGRYDEAKKALRELKRKENITTDFLSLKADIERQMSEEGTWKDMVMIGSNRKALAAGIFLRTSHTVGGAEAFVYFSQYIFDKSEGTFTTEESSMIFISLKLLLGIIASFAVNVIGRKNAYIWSLSPCGIVLLVEAIYFFIYQNRPDIDKSHYDWIPLLGMILYAIFSSYGLNLMPSLMLGELFSISFRAKGISIVMITNGISGFITSSLFYTLSSNYGLFAPFLFFACCDIISAVLSHFILPETKNRTLEEIQQAMKSNKTNELVKESVELI